MEFIIHKREMVCIDGDARDLEVTSFSGVLWITQAGDPNDYILSAGEQFSISRKGRVTITACKTAKAHFSSTVSLTTPDTQWQVHLQTA